MVDAITTERVLHHSEATVVADGCNVETTKLVNPSIPLTPQSRKRVNVEDISPLPTLKTATGSGKKRATRTTTAAVLTSSPYKTQL